MTAETDIAAIANSGDNTPAIVRTALTSVLARADVFADATTDWTTWTPAYTNLTVGNGTVTPRYTNVNGLVLAQYTLVFGSTTSISGGAPLITLPVTAANVYNFVTGNAVGTALAVDDTGNRQAMLTHLHSTTQFRVMALTVSGSAVIESSITSTVPFTWATSDVLFAQMLYEAA